MRTASDGEFSVLRGKAHSRHRGGLQGARPARQRRRAVDERVGLATLAGRAGLGGTLMRRRHEWRIGDLAQQAGVVQVVGSQDEQRLLARK